VYDDAQDGAATARKTEGLASQLLRESDVCCSASTSTITRIFAAT
jgi:hypothetical protein